MTDMKISVEAVEAARTGYLSVAPEAHMIAKLAESLEAALTYYAAHPEELPEEVVDAVLADAPRRQMQSLAKRMLDRQMETDRKAEMDRILDEQSKRDT